MVQVIFIVQGGPQGHGELFERQTMSTISFFLHFTPIPKRGEVSF